MKTIYLDCGMGAAGDMLAGALIELLPDPDAFAEKLNTLSIPDVQFIKERSVKCGITGTHLSVLVQGAEESEHVHGHHHADMQEHVHGHHHAGMKEIERIISGIAVPAKVLEDVLAVYRLLAEAESSVHGMPVTDIHFHEVGTMDAIADITAVCLLMDELSPDEVVVSPVHVGAGKVKCAHGVLPVPAPATACLLKDIPIYGGEIQGELCTPTGAALIRYFADRFADMPVMKISKIGYGMGKKDFETVNCVRAMFGETAGKTDDILELSCNVDDMTAEEIAYAVDCLLENGANDVYTVSIGMKKSRPGTLIRVICKECDRETMLQLLFKHTTTIGVREAAMHRHVLERSIESVQTSFGTVQRKLSSGYGVRRIKYEYEDLSRIARREGLSLDEVRKKLIE